MPQPLGELRAGSRIGHSSRMRKTPYALLLRAVNVGGHGSLPMATLREVLTGLGYENVATYLQSGNAVLTTSQSATALIDAVQGALKQRMGQDIDAVVRTAAQLDRIVEHGPLPPALAPTSKHVTFLRKASDSAPLSALPLKDLTPERLFIEGTEVYLLLPNGIGRSKLAALVTQRLKATPGTTRNWNTVVALRDMTASL
jgi:uncharacterized protein (DUF1697 family)